MGDPAFPKENSVGILALEMTSKVGGTCCSLKRRREKEKNPLVKGMNGMNSYPATWGLYFSP